MKVLVVVKGIPSHLFAITQECSRMYGNTLIGKLQQQYEQVANLCSHSVAKGPSFLHK